MLTISQRCPPWLRQTCSERALERNDHLLPTPLWWRAFIQFLRHFVQALPSPLLLSYLRSCQTIPNRFGSCGNTSHMLVPFHVLRRYLCMLSSTKSLESIASGSLYQSRGILYRAGGSECCNRLRPITPSCPSAIGVTCCETRKGRPDRGVCSWLFVSNVQSKRGRGAKGLSLVFQSCLSSVS